MQMGRQWWRPNLSSVSRVTLNFDLPTPKVDHFMSFPRRLLTTPICIQIGLFIFRFTNLVDKRTDGRTNGQHHASAGESESELTNPSNSIPRANPRTCHKVVLQAAGWPLPQYGSRCITFGKCCKKMNENGSLHLMHFKAASCLQN